MMLYINKTNEERTFPFNMYDMVAGVGYTELSCLHYNIVAAVKVAICMVPGAKQRENQSTRN